MRHLWITCVAVALCGCSTLTDLRASAPTRTVSFAGEYEAAAECIARGIDALDEPPPLLRTNRAERAVNITLIVNGHVAAYDIEVRQSGDLVAVSGRGMPTVGGRDLHVSRVWPAVERCAHQKSPGAAAGV